ncbi:MAG: ABC transporter permease [Myxococcales bacterium]|nr:ABC transporter permease [Myxococcales bacterium]
MSASPDTMASATPGPSPATPSWRRFFDDPNPILVKELRTTLRASLFVRFLYLSTGLVALLVVGIGGAAAGGNEAPAEVGQILFQVFFGGALTILCLVAPSYAATSLTSEKETGTYESLVLTGMDPARIVWGKFLASYAVFALVLVAFAPIVGIAFLFGGTSPWHVLIGFYGLLLVLGPAIALGVALSARLRSTRVAILIALITFVPAAIIGASAMSGLGYAARSEWGVSMQGPFWFTEALASRFFELDTFLLLGVLPLYASGMMVWFFLASAIAGVRPAAEDRSTPFKHWALAALAGLLATTFGVTSLFGSGRDAGIGSFVLTGFAGLVVLQLALLFTNEPPLPPRLWELRQEGRGALGKLAGLFGPGAAPTARFGAVVVVAASVGAGLAAALSRHLQHPSWDDHAQADAAIAVVALGHAAVGLFVLMFGAWLRVILRSGVASRVITLSALFALGIIPFFVALLAATGMGSFEESSGVLLVTPVSHLITGGFVMDGKTERAIEVLVPASFYGLLAVIFWSLLEARVRGVGKRVAEQRALRERRAEEAAASRPSFTPPVGEVIAAIAAGAPLDVAVAGGAPLAGVAHLAEPGEAAPRAFALDGASAGGASTGGASAGGASTGDTSTGGASASSASSGGPMGGTSRGDASADSPDEEPDRGDPA